VSGTPDLREVAHRELDDARYWLTRAASTGAHSELYLRQAHVHATLALAETLVDVRDLLRERLPFVLDYPEGNAHD